MDGSALTCAEQASFHGVPRTGLWLPWHTLNRWVQIYKQAEVEATELVYKT
jgi:hypothetical protein